MNIDCKMIKTKPKTVIKNDFPSFSTPASSLGYTPNVGDVPLLNGLLGGGGAKTFF